jgi:hypothetical protein
MGGVVHTRPQLCASLSTSSGVCLTPPWRLSLGFDADPWPVHHVECRAVHAARVSVQSLDVEAWNGVVVAVQSPQHHLLFLHKKWRRAR